MPANANKPPTSAAATITLDDVTDAKAIAMHCFNKLDPELVLLIAQTIALNRLATILAELPEIAAFRLGD